MEIGYEAFHLTRARRVSLAAEGLCSLLAIAD